MSTFTEAEVEYLNSQTLGRVATVGPDGRPHVTPVGIFYDPETEDLVVGSHTDLATSKKFRHARPRPDVAVVIDDLAALNPWTPRGIEVHGHAETHTDGGEKVGKRLGARYPFDRGWISIYPRRILSWGIESDSFAPSARDAS